MHSKQQGWRPTGFFFCPGWQLLEHIDTGTWVGGGQETLSALSRSPGPLLSPSYPSSGEGNWPLLGRGRCQDCRWHWTVIDMLLALPNKDLIYLLRETALSC